MTRYLVKRLGQSLLAIFLTVSTVFVLVRLASGDPAKAYAGPFATTEQLEEVRRQFGLDRPLLEQYLVFRPRPRRPRHLVQLPGTGD